jgi:hypothetical protein
MLDLEEFLMLRDLFNKELSISEIARRTGHSRSTVGKYLRSQAPLTSRKRSKKPSELDDYREYIISRLQEYPLSENTFALLGLRIYKSRPMESLLDSKIAQRPTRFWAEVRSSLFEVVIVVISPEPFIQKCKSLARSRDLQLEVKDGRVRLAWKDCAAANFMERTDVIGLGISYDMLLDALIEAGGAIDADGRYPINDAIRQRLLKLFNVRHMV